MYHATECMRIQSRLPILPSPDFVCKRLRGRYTVLVVPIFRTDVPGSQHTRKSHAKIRLFCFPYAGGNSVAFLPWQQEAVPEVAVTHCGAEEFHSLLCSVYWPPARLMEPCD